MKYGGLVDVSNIFDIDVRKVADKIAAKAVELQLTRTEWMALQALIAQTLKYELSRAGCDAHMGNKFKSEGWED